MSDDNKAQITVDGDVSPLRRALREAVADINRFGAEGESAVGRMTGPLAALQKTFMAVASVFAGGAVFKEAVAQAVLFTEESTKLARAMGISASEASVLREALEQGNTSQEEFVGASKGLAKQLRTNEDALQAMGLKTRDATGALRPLTDLTLEAIGVLTSYKQGTDRAIAGQVLFGKGFEMTSNLAEMNKQAVLEVGEQMQALGMIASVESVAAWQAYDDAGDKAHTTLKGFKVTIGNALMPVLTQLAEWFSSIGPAAVVVIRGAVGGLISVFWLLTAALRQVSELLNAMVFTIAEPIIAVVEALGLALTGNFSEAASRMKQMATNTEAAWRTAFRNIAAEGNAAGQKILNLFTEGTPTAAPGKGGKSATGLIKADKGDKKAPEEKSFMALYEAQLAAAKNMYEQENTLRQYSKEQELAYWRELLANYNLTNKDRLAITKKSADLELDIRRKSAKEQRDIDSFMVDHKRNGALAQVQYDEAVSRNAQENGAITKRALLDLEDDFARRRFEIEYQAAMERVELLKTDPTITPAALLQAKEQMLEIERNYILRRQELGQNRKKEENSFGMVFDDAGSAFGTMANDMLMKAQTLRQGLAGVFQSIAQSFVKYMITDKISAYVASEAKLLAVKLGFMKADLIAEKAASLATTSNKAAETTTVVTGNAAQAGSGAAKSLADIPVVGPYLAMAAMAMVFAGVMGLIGKKSAARGYDIPRGLNPMTQLHEEEMVLPQKFANVIRDLADSGGRGGGDIHVNYHVKAWDSRDVGQFLLKNKGHIAEALKSAVRDFHPMK